MPKARDFFRSLKNWIPKIYFLVEFGPFWAKINENSPGYLLKIGHLLHFVSRFWIQGLTPIRSPPCYATGVTRNFFRGAKGFPGRARPKLYQIFDSYYIFYPFKKICQKTQTFLPFFLQNFQLGWSRGEVRVLPCPVPFPPDAHV